MTGASAGAGGANVAGGTGAAAGTSAPTGRACAGGTGAAAGTGAVGTEALGAMAGWPVGAAAGAVVGPNGVIETFGDVRQGVRAGVGDEAAGRAGRAGRGRGGGDRVWTTRCPAAASAVVPGATVRHLLAHASGLAADRLVQAVAPGTRRIYSNVGIEALADQVATAAGMPFPDYFREAVAEPLRLDATTTGARASRDGISTVADLARVVFELLAPTGLLHPTTLAAATSVQFPGLARRAARLRTAGGERLGSGVRDQGGQGPALDRCGQFPAYVRSFRPGRDDAVGGPGRAGWAWSR